MRYESEQDYSQRLDVDNRLNAPPIGFTPGGYREFWKAIGLALNGDSWQSEMLEAIQRQYIGTAMDYFWHVKFAEIFSPRKLSRINWTSRTEAMAMTLILGLEKQGLHFAFLIGASLRQGFVTTKNLIDEHRRGHAFIIRLIERWAGVDLLDWPEVLKDRPEYEELLVMWDTVDQAKLTAPLLSASDYHVSQMQPEGDGSSVYHDFASMNVIPLEILLLFRLRESRGLANPTLNHPLLTAPFGALPTPVDAAREDPLLFGALDRLRADWPDFDVVISADSVSQFDADESPSTCST